MLQVKETLLGQMSNVKVQSVASVTQMAGVVDIATTQRNETTPQAQVSALNDHLLHTLQVSHLNYTDQKDLSMERYTVGVSCAAPITFLRNFRMF